MTDRPIRKLYDDLLLVLNISRVSHIHGITDQVNYRVASLLTSCVNHIRFLTCAWSTPSGLKKCPCPLPRGVVFLTF